MQANKSNYKPPLQPESPSKINANLSPRGKQIETPSAVKKIKLKIKDDKGGYTPTLIAKNNK
jgi:hypothetical protein